MTHGLPWTNQRVGKSTWPRKFITHENVFLLFFFNDNNYVFSRLVLACQIDWDAARRVRTSLVNSDFWWLRRDVIRYVMGLETRRPAALPFHTAMRVGRPSSYCLIVSNCSLCLLSYHLLPPVNGSYVLASQEWLLTTDQNFLRFGRTTFSKHKANSQSRKYPCDISKDGIKGCCASVRHAVQINQRASIFVWNVQCT